MSDTIGEGLWSASDRGDTVRVKELLANNKDGNARNCLGCTPLLYACGSGHLETVKALLDQPTVDINRRNNDRLTSFMLAMQGGPLIGRLGNLGLLGVGDGGTNSGIPPQSHATGGNAQEKMRRLMDLPATDDLEWTRHDRWTALMEACNFGHENIVQLLLSIPNVDLEAVNLRGQRAEDVALSRGHDQIAEMIKSARQTREHPEELPRIKELVEQVENLKMETRQRLLHSIDNKYETLRDIKNRHESEIEPLTIKIDSLNEQLDEVMKSRMAMITRQVREVKNLEEEIRQMKRKLDNFDRYASTGNLISGAGSNTPGGGGGTTLLLGSNGRGINAGGSNPDLSIFEKDFECSVCLDDMKPPVKIFQCRNGHVMCEVCKSHPDVITCPSCRIPLNGSNSLMRNIPMEKLARSYYDRIDGSINVSPSTRRRRPSGSSAQISSAQGSPRHGSRSTSRSRRGSREQLGVLPRNFLSQQ